MSNHVYKSIELTGSSPKGLEQAVANAIDRKAIATAMGTGLPFVPNLIGNHWFMPTQDGYKDNSGDAGRYAG